MGEGAGEDAEQPGRGAQPRMNTGWPVAICGKREFAWTWTPVENGREVRWRWVIRLTPLGGILPTFNGEILTHTTGIPFCHASPIKQFIYDMTGQAMNVKRRHRATITALAWLVAVECITIILAFIFGYPPEFGGLHVGLPVPLYIPGAFLTWGGLLDPGYQWMVTAAAVASAVVGIALLLRLLFDLQRNQGVQDSRVHKSIYGGREQAKKDGLL